MTAFANISKLEQITYIREEYIQLAERLLSKPAELQKLIPADQFKAAHDFILSIKPSDCTCNECISLEKLDGIVPKELACLIPIAKKNCLERVY